ncbi:hypothetical protein F5Y05DRAFT_241248 [Hypoxylon sp. FL0543]|nr:hypothetical protein F5Y05DRAFT_241248 [Hypoxylon sp. FL0543]
MPSFFIPARNSRHRIACFALYRALLKQAPRIPLPDDLATAWGPGNPIKHLIRRAFRRNLTDTSPRLVYPALKAGYQSLALLRSAASSPSSASPNADHDSIISFLRARLDERNRSLEAKIRHPPHSRNPPKQSTAPRPGTLPLLVNVTPAPTRQNPNPEPKYVTPSRPRPASELGGTGRRKIPKIDMASDFPILRITKPQPLVMSRVLTQKILKRVARMDLIVATKEEIMPDADLEDQWEKSVMVLLEQEGRKRAGGGREDLSRGSRRSGGKVNTEAREAQAIRNELRYGNTFRQTIHIHSNIYLQEVLTREREHQVARADAMRRLIEEETKLAEQEKAQRAAERRKRWEDKMLELHGEGWRKLFPNLEESKPHTTAPAKRVTGLRA